MTGVEIWARGSVSAQWGEFVAVELYDAGGANSRVKFPDGSFGMRKNNEIK